MFKRMLESKGINAEMFNARARAKGYKSAADMMFDLADGLDYVGDNHATSEREKKLVHSIARAVASRSYRYKYSEPYCTVIVLDEEIERISNELGETINIEQVAACFNAM